LEYLTELYNQQLPTVDGSFAQFPNPKKSTGSGSMMANWFVLLLLPIVVEATAVTIAADNFSASALPVGLGFFGT
jgi:hypothetical protein